MFAIRWFQNVSFSQVTFFFFLKVSIMTFPNVAMDQTAASLQELTPRRKCQACAFNSIMLIFVEFHVNSIVKGSKSECFDNFLQLLVPYQNEP